MMPWASCVVALTRRSKSKSHLVESFGSGFLASLRGKVFLCTAAHVVKDSETEVKVAGTLGGVELDITGLKFLCSDASDVAIAPIGKQRESFEPSQLITVLEDGPASQLWSDQIALLGFPYTLNRLGGFKKDDLRLVKVLAEYIPAPPVGLKRPNTRSPIFMRDPGKSRWLQEGNRAVMPKLGGISGGPALQLFKNQETGELVFQVVGMTIEHHVGKCYVATNRKEIRRAAEQIVG